jgi:1-acyl-sn-glycerol-3-phosphate acyltransferase
VTPRPDSLSFAKRLWYDFLRVVVRLVAVVLWRVRVNGREHWPSEGGMLVLANHQSLLDPMLVGLTCDRRLNYLARQTLFRFTPFRLLIESLDAIPVDREGLGLAGLKETLRRLKRGEMVLIFPEGTRTSDGEVGPFKPGFSALATRGGVPMLPVALDGAYQMWPRRQLLPVPWGTINIEIGEPISPEEAARHNDRELVELVQARITELHARARERRGGGRSVRVD